MRRAHFIALLSAALLICLPGSVASARVIRDGASGRPLSCPDPSVLDAGTGRFRYYLVCTSDFGVNALPVRGSDDLVRWSFISNVLPAGHQPWWALHSPRGRYWAPAVYRIGHRWVVYFAAQYDAGKVHLSQPGGEWLKPGSMVLGVATAWTLRGPWRTRLLHYRGEFNAQGGEQEQYGGVIDPSVVMDPVSRRKYLLWAEQHSSIWVTRLSDDGLSLDPGVHQALIVQQGWECFGGCTVEGPEGFFRRGLFYLLYSGASTWTGSYAVGAAVAPDPLHGRFRRVSANPLLASSSRWVGPGGSSHPIAGPDGRYHLFYHAMTGPNVNHISANRFLLESPFTFPGPAASSRPVPSVGTGRAG